MRGGGLDGSLSSASGLIPVPRYLHLTVPLAVSEFDWGCGQLSCSLGYPPALSLEFALGPLLPPFLRSGMGGSRHEESLSPALDLTYQLGEEPMESSLCPPLTSQVL